MFFGDIVFIATGEPNELQKIHKIHEFLSIIQMAVDFQ